MGFGGTTMTLRSGSVVLAALLLAAAQAVAAPRVLVPDDIYNLRDVSAAHLSPDGQWVVYSVRQADAKDDRSYSHVWMARYDGGGEVQLTGRSKESESEPRFSPDGRYISFLSGRADEKKNDAVWLLPRAGGEARKLTDFKSDVKDYAWSPDGTRLVLVVEDEDKEASDDKDAPPKPIVIDRFRFMQDVVGYLTTKRDYLYLLDVASGKVAPLTSGPYSEGMPSWSPDGKWIAFVSKHHPDADHDNNWGLYVVAPEPGANPRLVADQVAGGFDADTPGSITVNAWSPDSRSIAYIHGGDPKLIEYATDRLAVVSIDGGTPRILTPTLDRNVGAPHWSDDGQSITVLVEDDRTTYLARIPAGGGAPARIAGGRDDISSYDTVHGRFVVHLSSPLAPAELFAVSGAGASRQITHENAWLKDVSLSPVEETSFASRDGTEVHGFLLKPPGVSGGHLPTVLRIHGGPQSQYSLSFNFEWQVIAAHGYAVVAADPRGSTGRGQAYCAAIYADWGDKDVQDELAAVDDAVKKGVADPARLGVGGWSYGGMLTNYVIASDSRFKAATSGASIADILGGYGNDQYAYDYEMELGKPWQNTATWLKISFPFLHADRIVTPTLFLGGDKDMNVPLHNGEQMYEALKSQGIDTELVIYPGQFHGLTRPSFIKDRYERYLAWYDKHLKG